ncbi:MAG: N-acetylmuramoyl-L-alanine amidase [Candidatus Krumholzibacteriia bacterium]
MILVGGSLLALVGCAHRVDVPRDPADVPGYLNAPPDLAGVDVSALRGRRILVDPGHGGRFRGAVADQGLTEAEVNLGVALYLQGLLQWAGAEVVLTRTADVDFLTPADSTLAGDLAARVAMADSLRPDVFLSIHHNSTASRDPDINETQTYYPLGREGADRDLALAIHRQLVRALEIAPARILPGGFHVLRESPVPAVLGEPAMISNPVIAGRLSLARSLELEARAYFLGLRDYFAAGSPRWLTAVPDTLVRGSRAEYTWTFDPGGEGAPGPDPATLAVLADGRSLAPRWSADGLTVSLADPDLAACHGLDLTVRNLAGRAATRSHAVVPGAPGPWSITAIADGRGRVLLTYTAADLDFVRDGPFDLMATTGASAPIPLPAGRGPRGWLLMDDPPADLATRRIAPREERRDHADSGAMPARLDLGAGWSWLTLVAPAAIWPDRDVPGHGWRDRSPGAGRPSFTPPTDWPAYPAPSGQPLWLEADGALPVLRDPDGRSPWSPTADADQDTLAWQPLLPALVGRRVAIDPRGGGTDEQTRGPFGTRGSDLNLRLAGRLAALLGGLGREVTLVRDDELAAPEPVKVLRADRAGAELYLALGRGTPAVLHHPGSRQGEPWARRRPRPWRRCWRRRWRSPRPTTTCCGTPPVRPSWSCSKRSTVRPPRNGSRTSPGRTRCRGRCCAESSSSWRPARRGGRPPTGWPASASAPSLAGISTTCVSTATSCGCRLLDRRPGRPYRHGRPAIRACPGLPSVTFSNCTPARTGSSGPWSGRRQGIGMVGSSWRTAERSVALSPTSEPPRRLFSPRSEAERARVGRRLLWALPAALLILVILAVLGPDAETIERKFTPYGDAGPLRLMPEISIDDGEMQRHQRAAAEAVPPPAAPDYQIEPDELSADATEVAPRSHDTRSDVAGLDEGLEDRPQTDAKIASDGDATVDMDLPSQQVDSDFIITRLVRPLYPARATPDDRARPLITVEAAFFLNETGAIVALIIQSNDGGPEFAAAAREAMEQWEFQPRLRDGQPPAPRWLVVTWRFRSPFSGLPR